ncbi:class I SAM-dependent methyltransferase [Salinicoccus sp. HZC-1]|uniref:class I SAM-dependent methyltransferase n=1 Tax=Salinicoccus sp. HZC-1 TaxID=3385497 RepID=UPI00398A8342
MEENVFNAMAKKYDTADRIELANIITGEVKNELNGRTYGSLLDYGGGTGLVSFELADQFESILLADASAEMVKAAEGKISDRGLDNIETLHLDLTKDYTDLNADVILVSLVLLHVPDTADLLRSLYKTLNEGGRLIIVDFDKHPEIDHPKVHNGFTHEEIRGRLMEAGFDDAEVRTFHHGKNIFMNKDASMFLAGATK